MALKNPPLTDQHYPVIQQGIDDAEEALGHIELAKQAGLDVSNLEKGAKETRDRLLKIKSVYFPGR